MEYKNDKGEFISFIKAGLGDKENNHVDVCLKRVTKPVTEKFLNDRANLYKTDVDNDSELIEDWLLYAMKKNRNAISVL